jgi:HEPN domain-containing protein
MFYISVRYPDAFPGSAPFEIITEEQADRALHASLSIMAMVKEKIAHAAK